MPRNQFGFRKGKLSLEYVGTVMCNVLQGMGLDEGTQALVLDLNGAFKSVLHGLLVRQLIDIRFPGRILNVASFFTISVYT